MGGIPGLKKGTNVGYLQFKLEPFSNGSFGLIQCEIKILATLVKQEAPRLPWSHHWSSLCTGKSFWFLFYILSWELCRGLLLDQQKYLFSHWTAQGTKRNRNWFTLILKLSFYLIHFREDKNKGQIQSGVHGSSETGTGERIHVQSLHHDSPQSRTCQ